MSLPKAAGIETEFAIVGAPVIQASAQVVGAYQAAARHASPRRLVPEGAHPGFGFDPGSEVWLPNGARFYVDHAHPEYSTAESADPCEVAALDCAGNHVVQSCADYVNAAAPDRPPLRLYKNNSDHLGNSYGCHENYLLDARTYQAIFDGSTPWIDDYLIPFFVSRIVVTGAGKVGAENGTAPALYQLSQRADFFETLVGLQTTHRRPIVNTRDEPHADRQRFRRLHVIAGDANLCPCANWLKVGTAQIMLRLLEDGALGPGWALADPLDAIRRISRDPACEVRVPLADGRALSALDLQRAFCEAAQRYFARAAPTPAEAQVVEHWARTLCDLGTDPWLLAGRLDWVTKRLIIGQLAAEAGWDWDSPQAQEADMQYHALYPPESLFYELEEAGLIAYPPGWSADAVNRLVEQPPAGARAFVRGTCVARFAPDIIRMDWEYVQFRSGTLALPDPLRGGEAELPPDLSQVTAAGQPAQPPAAPLPLNGETK